MQSYINKPMNTEHELIYTQKSKKKQENKTKIKTKTKNMKLNETKKNTVVVNLYSIKHWT